LSLRVGLSEVGGEEDVELGEERLASIVDCGGADEVAIPVSVSSRVSFGKAELELLPNILFSNPPWEEKLLLCFPASVLTLVESACWLGIVDWRGAEDRV
jgi:hypothetical protein